jgi:superfamily I DNA/RNA helicase
MIYDVRETYSDLKDQYETHKKTEQALAQHEARNADHTKLWQAVGQWLRAHDARLISELPSLLLDRLRGGDFRGMEYQHVIVDEFQDLTPGEQELFVALRRRGGSFVALGDPRQSIYAFRGNDSQGLSKLDDLIKDTKLNVHGVEMSECQRCPADVVKAANQLMSLSKAVPMVPGSSASAETHVVVWTTPQAEAKGMAAVIVKSLADHPRDKHLVMVTRRNFGYWLRQEITGQNPSLKVDLNFSESLLETWPVREAFLYFCLRADPDAPSWRAWFGYQHAPTGKGFGSSERNAGAYLQLLEACGGAVTREVVEKTARAEKKPPGSGGKNVWERAQRFLELGDAFKCDGKDPAAFTEMVFADSAWIVDTLEDKETPRIDMEICRDKARAMLEELKLVKPGKSAAYYLKQVAQRLRYQIATREPFVPEEQTDVQVATMWGAKGITADRVFILGLCQEAIPGTRRPEYPGDDVDYFEEQRRLFYVSITRSKHLLVLSRPLSMQFRDAARMGLQGTSPKRRGSWVDFEMSPFLRDIRAHIPRAEQGADWLVKMLK